MLYSKQSLRKSIIKKTLRVPLIEGRAGDGEAASRQLDVALMSVGFKLSGALLKDLNSLDAVVLHDVSMEILDAVRELVGDHVTHNVYFKNFPEGVPDTEEFWCTCIVDALLNPRSSGIISAQLQAGTVNLLDLPKYGKYQHTYEEMLAAHDDFMPSAKDKATILHLGKSLSTEAFSLYHSLAGSAIPINEEERDLLAVLAEVCLSGLQPESIPIRENRAIINKVRLEHNRAILVNTVTDVLRLACVLSDGDVTLQEMTKFKSFPRKIRRFLLSALDGIIEESPSKLADVNQYKEQWKRLCEHLHPYEYTRYPHALDVFAVARGDKKVRSLAAKVEMAFNDGNINKAIAILSNAPGMLFRNIDRILRKSSAEHYKYLVTTIEQTIPKVSGRVILSVLEHLNNRLIGHDKQSRIFANSKGTAWVAEDDRKPLDANIVHELGIIFELEIVKRLPKTERLVIDKRVLSLAMPLSNKNKSEGFNIVPRGSIMPIDSQVLRFFIYWKQKEDRTDYDLSVILLDEDFNSIGHLSYTSLTMDGGVHSGDITNAPNGASEFIDIDLNKTNVKYIIPSVNVYSGEGFNDVAESFFGFMTRVPEQRGKPFEAATVKAKFAMRGKGRIALPVVFINDGGVWQAKWLNLYMNGNPNFNRVEINRLSTSLIARSIVERQYFQVSEFIALMSEVQHYELYTGRGITEPVTYIGLEVPEDLPDGSVVYNLNNLHELIPE